MNPELRNRFDEAGKFMRSGQLQSAKDILEDLAKLDSKSPAILSVLGHAYWKMGLLDQAAATFRSATELAPKLEAASLGLFHCLLETDKQEQALEEVRRYILISHSQTYYDIIDENYERLLQSGVVKERLKKKEP